MELSPIRNMQAAADYVSQQPRSNRVVIYGDEDVDGVCSVIIVKEALGRLGFEQIETLFCLHETEGHGFSLKALDFIKDKAPALLILVDLGISDNQGIAQARDLGFEVLVIDHHEPLSPELPPANFIINPKDPADSYHFKQLAAAGLCYHFARWLLQDDPDFDLLDEQLVRLAGLATIADMMPLEHDNMVIVNRMMDLLPSTSQVALRALLDRYLTQEKTLKEAIHQIIATLNASQVNQQRQAESFLLLTEDKPARAVKIIQTLESRWREYLVLREEIILEAQQRLNEESLEEVIFVGGENWPRRVIAAVASRLADEYNRPAFVYSQMAKIARGSARSPEGIDCVALMSACSKHLINFGGHPPAAGFEIKNENLQKFRLCLIENYRQLYG